MRAKNNKSNKSSVSERLFASWLKHDPFVKLVLKNDDEARRDIMLDLLGPEATKKHFGKFYRQKKQVHIILPQHVRDKEEKFIQHPNQRTDIIKRLVHWGTDKYLNSRNPNSHLTRMQIISSLLGSIFYHANVDQEKLIILGLKKIAITRLTNLDKRGEPSPQVHRLLLSHLGDLLIHNQKAIFHKTTQEAGQMMQAQLIRSIQELKDKKVITPAYIPETKIKKTKIASEKFPLPKEITKELHQLLQFYLHCRWSSLCRDAHQIRQTLKAIRKPIKLTPEKQAG